MKTIFLGLTLLFAFHAKAQIDTTTHRDTSGGGDTTVLNDTTFHGVTIGSSDTTAAIDYFAVTDMNGNHHSILDYVGEKIWLVILPSSSAPSDSAFLMRIDSVSLANKGKVKTIAVPSFEDGYVDDSSHTMLTWYQTHLDTGIVISQPIYTHLVSGVSQAGLFQWLTHSSLNGHFAIDISGFGTMFFLNEQSLLDGVFDDDSKWSNKALNMMLQ